MLIAVSKNKFIVSFIMIFGTLSFTSTAAVSEFRVEITWKIDSTLGAWLRERAQLID